MRKSLAALLIFSAWLAAQLTPPGGGGGGSSGQSSAPSVGYTTGTYYFPAGGGAAANGTRHECSHTAGGDPWIGTISKFSVTGSPRGTGSGSAVFTWYDGTSSQTVWDVYEFTASANGCSDTTHSFTYSSRRTCSQYQMVVSTATITSAVTMTWGARPEPQGANQREPEGTVTRERLRHKRDHPARQG